MRFAPLAVAFLAAATACLLTTTAFERDASACGGCFHPPPGENPTVVTDHRMILTVSKAQSTLYDQIEYSGAPSAFAWVLPISGTVDVGLSADTLFQVLDTTTQTNVLQPPLDCPSPAASCLARQGVEAGVVGTGGSIGVTVTQRQVVGPYETVQLKATDASSLANWLSMNGFVVPADVQPVVAQYVAEKFDFLALRLLPDKGVQDMRPVRVTTHGASAVLPLRMVAAGTGPVVGITLWVIGEGRYEPQNFPNFAILETDLVWDWTQSRSNYTDLRAQHTAESNGRAWEIESSDAANRTVIENTLQLGQGDYLPEKDAQGNVTMTDVQVRDADLATLFNGIDANSTRITRMRADLTHASLSADLIMIASASQGVLPASRQVTKEANEPLCPVYDGCDVTGTAPRSQAAAESASNDPSSSCALGGTKGAPVWLGVGMGCVAFAFLRLRRRLRS